MAFGVDSTGFTIKSLADIRSALEADFREQFGAGVDVGYDTVFGRIIGIMSGALDEVWQSAQNNYNSRVPNNADGVLLDNLASVLGMSRNGATKATADVTITCTSESIGDSIPATFEVGIGSDGGTFIIDAAVTISAYGAGVNLAVSNFSSGVSSHSIDIEGTVYGPETGATQEAVLDALAVDMEADGYTTERTGTGSSAVLYVQGPLSSVTGVSRVTSTALPGYRTSFTAREAGALTGSIGAVDTIITPIAGVTSVSNEAVVNPGFDSETDAELRIRMEAAPEIIGVNTIDAIRSRLAGIDDVTDVAVYENETGTVDAEGRPSHSIHAIVYPDTVLASSIASVLWGTKPAGIQTYGSESETVQDSQEFDHTVNFDYATEVSVNVELDVTTGDDFPADGETQIQTAIAAVINATLMRDGVVRVFRLYGAIDEIAGITDATITTPAANVTLAVGEKAAAGTITVNIT